MIPTGFVIVDELPLNAHGKVDRSRLPESPDDAGGMDFVAPRNDTEKAVCEEWAQVLATGLVGVTDDFFQLGGHSLLATALTARLRRRLGIRVPVRMLFDHPTAEAFAAAIDDLLDRR